MADAFLSSLQTSPADHSQVGIHWPWLPYARRQLPSATFPREAYQDKMPLVAKIAFIYEVPEEEEDEVPEGEVARWREFTGWQQALFYAFPLAVLRSLVPFPRRIKRYGDQAKRFALLFVQGTITFDSPDQVATTNLSTEFSLALQVALSAVLRRDSRLCMVLSRAGPPVSFVRIVPRAVLDLRAPALKSLLRLASRFFDKTFRSYLYDTIRVLQELGDRPWNFLTLDKGIREMYRRGMVGFKPSHVAVERNMEGRVKTYQAVFSFHWLGRNLVDGDEMVTADDDFLDEMVARGDFFGPDRGGNCAYDVYACRVHDGEFIYVDCEGKDQAQMMLSMLALRWVAGSVWWLAGASGLGPGVVVDEESSQNYTTDDG